MSLLGLHIVLMRPREQALAWKENMIAEKAEVTILPMIDIIPTTVETSSLDTLLTADQVIITSQNAAKKAPTALIDILVKQKLPVTTIGIATTKSLIARGVEPVYTAPNGSQSEDLLAMPFLQADLVKGKKIVLIIGKGGRELIAEVLAARGATIHCLAVYAQQPIQYDLESWFEKWERSQKQVCFLVTSGNILFNFESQVPDKNKAWLRSQPLIVVSERLKGLAKECGFQHIINTYGAHWSCVSTTLQEVVKICHTSETP